MKNIRREISQILGVSIQLNEWESVFDLLDRENRLNSKMIHKILLVILKRLEELENEK